ncbi:MAG: hypothetical protein IT519_16745 [Burkholderiales bacterium]|nr:hypothetical protein [Burkholderiales bacterium]
MKRKQAGIFDLMTLLIVGGVFLAIVAAAWFAIHAIETKGYDRGVAEQSKETAKVAVDRDQWKATAATEKTLRLAAEGSVRDLTGALEKANASVDALAAAQHTAEARARAAIAKAASDAKRHSAEVARLKSIIAGPPLTTDTAAEAETILRQLAVARTGG